MEVTIQSPKRNTNKRYWLSWRKVYGNDKGSRGLWEKRFLDGGPFGAPHWQRMEAAVYAMRTVNRVSYRKTMEFIRLFYWYV